MIKTLPNGVKSFKLGIFTGDITQPISLMRALGPLAAMAKQDRRLELVFPSQDLPDPAQGQPGGQRLNWDWLVRCDAVFLLHPETDVHVHCAALAFQLGVPIWAEYVDDVFKVDASNPGFNFHSDRRQLAENIGTIARMARVVTCVSEHNREAILNGLNEARGDARPTGELENKFLVIPEGCLWPATQVTERRKCISWRGLGSHRQDVAEALPQLVEVARAFPDWEWVLGGDPAITREIGHHLAPICGPERVLLMPFWPTPFDMMQAWGGKLPYLHIVPLADTAFNRSKSHLAWLEASAIGAGVIVPDHLPEWQQAGVIKYRHGQIMTARADARPTLSEVMMREMRKFDGALHPNVAEARAAIFPNLTLGAMNRRRWAILHKLALDVFDLQEAPAKVEVGSN